MDNLARKQLAENPFAEHLLWVMGDLTSSGPQKRGISQQEIDRRLEIIKPYILRPFDLPGDQKNDLYMVPVSGGAEYDYRPGM